MEINKINHQDGESSVTDSKVSVEHDRKEHWISKIPVLNIYFSLPPQHPIHFIGLCAQVFLYYILYGYLQELMFTLKGFKDVAWFLSCYQFSIYTTLAFSQIGFSGLKQRRASCQSYLLLAILTVTTMGLSNYSLGYLNYPTQVMFKSCKLIPVLIGGILIQQKRFNRYDVAAAICMSIGLIFFTLADSKVQPIFNPYGVFLICSALVADAVIGNYQEKVMKTHHVPNVEIIFYSFLFGFCIIVTGLLVTDKLFTCIAFWNQHPVRTYGYGLIFSVVGYLGIDIVLTLVKEYGALICVTVTTCRKAITIVLSFLLFTKPFVFDYIWSGLIVVVGIYLNVYSRYQAVCDARIRSYATSLFGARFVSKFTTSPASRPLPI